MYRVLVDARSLTDTPNGTSNFTISAINSWHQEHEDVFFFLVAHKPFNASLFSQLLFPHRVKYIVANLPVFPLASFTWFLLFLPALLFLNKYDLFWSPSGLLPLFLPKHIKSLVTIHDLVFLDFPETMHWKTRIMYSIFAFPAVTKSSFLWFVSTYTKKNFERHFSNLRPLDRSNHIIGSGINLTRFSTPSSLAECLHPMLSNQPTLLCVGTLEPRKNIPFLIQVFLTLPLDYNLIVVGCSGWGNHFPRDLKQIINANERIRFLGFISDRYLQSLYERSTLLVSVSKDEGFGLPILESMYFGCPVVVANNSAQSELVENAGIKVDGWEPQEWRSTIISLVQNRALYADACAFNYSKYSMSLAIRKLLPLIS
jgi:glycosyltransferase involved in cell wall biosynthesis